MNRGETDINEDFVECPGCGVRLPDRNLRLAERYHASGECLELFYELTCWTLTRQDSRFIHQYAVDSYAAQHSGERMHPITTIFALIGLYLAVEKKYTGREVQLAHIKIGRRKREWPWVEPPEHTGRITVHDVLRTETDAERVKMLLYWAASVWEEWGSCHRWVRETTERVLYGNSR